MQYRSGSQVQQHTATTSLILQHIFSTILYTIVQNCKIMKNEMQTTKLLLVQKSHAAQHHGSTTCMQSMGKQFDWGPQTNPHVVTSTSNLFQNQVRPFLPFPPFKKRTSPLWRETSQPPTILLVELHSLHAYQCLHTNISNLEK